MLHNIKTLLADLRYATEMQVKRLFIISKLQLVVNQVNGNFTTRYEGMVAYLKQVMNHFPHLEKF